MKRLFTLALSSAALAFASPVVAQEAEPTDEEMEQVMAQLAGAFPTEPLTAEQEGRLPQAQRIVASMIPEGTLGEMMGSMFDDMLGPIMEMAGGASASTVATGIGVPPAQLDLEDGQAEQLASIFDPSWAERRERESAVFPKMMADMMAVMEPPMRKAMSELYAINFSQQELDDIETFFNTETGSNFARKSFTMSSDPRIIAATMESLPEMMEAITGMETSMKEATADLPPVRDFADLGDEEKAKVAEATGFTVEEIKSNLAGDN